MAITWQPEYSVKVKEIDDQHKKLVEMIAALEEAINSSNTKEQLITILGELARYTEYHFKTEEKYFDEFKYEKAEEHKAQHKTLVDKVLQIIRKIDEDETKLSFELIDYLEDWLIQHIMGSDQDYVELFVANGLS